VSHKGLYTCAISVITSSLKREAYVNGFFYCSRSCELWICSIRTNCKPILLHWHLTVSAGKHAAKSTWSEIQGFSIMTTHVFTLLCLCMNFWFKTIWLSFHTLPTHQI
jgi:hypothetical protein